jgi:hypothetical protein
MKIKGSKLGLAVFLAVSFICAGVSIALDVTVEPTNAQREVGGKVRVNIYANNASNLISYGIKLTFNPAVLQAQSAQKYFNPSTLEGWLMDADGSTGTTNDQYTTPNAEIDNTNGSVTMIGGRLIGVTTTGLSGKVLLGHVVFNAVGNGNSNLALSVAKAPPFDNFVGLGTPPVVFDGDIAPVGSPVNKGVVCIRASACEGNLNTDAFVNLVDVGILKQEYGRTNCNAPGPGCLSDLNLDGFVNLVDVGIQKADYGRTDCSCP